MLWFRFHVLFSASFDSFAACLICETFLLLLTVWQMVEILAWKFSRQAVTKGLKAVNEWMDGKFNLLILSQYWKPFHLPVSTRRALCVNSTEEPLMRFS